MANPFFNATWIKKQKPKFVYEKKGNVTIWEPPQLPGGPAGDHPPAGSLHSLP